MNDYDNGFEDGFLHGYVMGDSNSDCGGGSGDNLMAVIGGIVVMVLFFLPSALICMALDINADDFSVALILVFGIFNLILVGALIVGIQLLRKK